jgi:hypothetical protein
MLVGFILVAGLIGQRFSSGQRRSCSSAGRWVRGRRGKAGLCHAGLPKAHATALAAAAEVIKERGLDVDENYAGHRGLL